MAMKERLLRWPWLLLWLLNLPVTREEWLAAREARRTGTPPTPQTAAAPAAASNPYLAAAANPAGAGGQAAPVARPDAAPWQQPVTSRPVNRSGWYVFLRGLVVAVLVFMVFLGVRSLFRPLDPPAPVVQEIPAAVQYPSAAASGLAERFTTAYLTWNEANADARGARLQLAGWSGDPKIGWNGSGRQSVSGQVTTAAVDATSTTSGSVTVVADVNTWAKTADGLAENPTRRTLALRVPVALTDGLLSVSAAPALVAVPRVPAPAGGSRPDLDSDLSTETRSAAEAFFTAYATDTDLTAITAPGAQIDGLGGAVTFGRITSWQVSEPLSNDEAAATAVVVWLGPDGSEAAQTYNLTLRKVASGTTSRWQIYRID